MRGLTFANGYFPFCVRKEAEDGEPLEEWDGSTRYGEVPSKSESSLISVYGDGTRYPVGFTLNELSEAYWRVKHQKITINLFSDFESYNITSYFGVSSSWYYDFDNDILTEGSIAFSPPFNEMSLVCHLADKFRTSMSGVNMPFYGGGSGTISHTFTAPVKPGFSGAVSSFSMDGGGNPPDSFSFFAALSTAKVFFHDGLYYPLFTIDLSASPVPGMSSVSWSDTTHNVGACDFWGHPVPLYTSDSFPYSATGTIDKADARYWTYGGIYNETTGSPV